MRLTLRTLLAYLDDTLQPNEIKAIGQKVSESEGAQELIARIKTVSRRRRLTTPPTTGPGARADANEVAEYLDNELSSDEVGELEKICLESDVHLAEMAACHQILTLVLGEPAIVPPTARERMYKLVQGRESIPYRKAAPVPATSALSPTSGDEDDTLAGLGGGWMKWVLPLAGLFLVVALGLAFWQVIAESPKQRTTARSGDGDLADGKERISVAPHEKTPTEGPSKEPDHSLPGDKDSAKGGTVTPAPGDKDRDPKVGPKPPEEKDPPKDPGSGTIKPVTHAGAPNPERVSVGQYIGTVGGTPSILVRNPADKDSWLRMVKGQPINSSEPLVCLPGFLSEIRTRSGVILTMRGHVREFSLHPLMDFLMESAVTLHKSEDMDLDLTLERGRIFLSNDKEQGPAKVRLRFATEVWDITLPERGAEVGVDLLKQYTRDIKYREGEEPRAELYLCLIKREAELRVDAYHTYTLAAPPGPALFRWDSFTKASGPIRLPELPPLWSKTPPDTALARDMVQALKDLDLRLTPKRTVENALLDGFLKSTPMPRQLALYGLAAIDDVSKLIDILGDEDPTRFLDRNTAIFALRRWISRGAKEGKRLYDEKENKGFLIDKRYRNAEADTFYTLLHDFSDEDRGNPETYQLLASLLGSPRVAIAELAYWHLLRLSVGLKLPDFNAAWPGRDREKVGDDIRTLIAKKRLPLEAPAAPAPAPEKVPAPTPEK